MIHMTSSSISMSSLNRTKSYQLESAMNEIEKLRKENVELKNQVSGYRRVLKQSNSQGSIHIVPLDGVTNSISEIEGSKNIDQNQVQMIDLRLSMIGREEGITVVMEHNEDPSTDYLQSSNILELEQRESSQSQFKLRSCFKGQRAI